ncbi:bifunctional protein FolD 1, mitochondrial-like [Chenopodium quinoa]|uniref:Methenyltetrahydrofolate cyclohydrolase n=1 Tax=Chenopodium quinoa TaxID=63459 RepID=A0A803MUX0_CHEQI|nr:bifunctional protein FolD 1, mitochondrial-like [Chenopodium quinoa]XP_021721110.1 bifunctional protein FolD 1, mitochondrial-like [Chenopodium quinoa]
MLAAVLRKSEAAMHTGLRSLRSLSSLANNGSCQILKSPPLVSLDLLEDWTCRVDQDRQETASIPNPSNQLTAALIDGKAISEEIRSKIANEVNRMKSSIGKTPGLAVILVGDRRDCQIYVRNKILACEEAGIRSEVVDLRESCSEDDILSALSNFNENPEIHGVLVQLPLPERLDEGKILSMLPLEKDVDGFHPLNMGNLALKGREPLFIPCTPKGCIELLLRSGVEIYGKRAVVIGRSNIVGLPTSLLLQRYHATVTVIHALTKNPEMLAREADIVVAAVGMPNLVRKSWLKPGAVVIDVGTYPIEDSSSDQGYRLLGDVCYGEAINVASAITPVPGGVGPMTVAMLLLNTLESAKRFYDFS